jgi:toxoflavin biosynthesis protein ToxC
MIQHRSPISGVAAFGREYVATAGYDNQVILWDGREKVAFSRAVHDHLVNQCAFSASGSHLVTASSDFTARIWSVPNLDLRAVLHHDDDVEMAVFDSRAERVATASRDRRARIFDNAGRLLHELRGHEADVLQVEWISDAELLSCSDDGDIRIWDASSGALRSSKRFGGVQMDAVAVGEGGTVYAGNDRGEILVLRGDASSAIPAHRAGVKRLVLDRSRRLLVSMGYDRRICTWQVGADGSLTEADSTVAPPQVWLRSCALDGDGRLIVGTFGSSYAGFDFRTGEWSFEHVEDTPGLNAVAEVEGAIVSVGDAGVVRRDGELLSRPGTLCNFLLQFGERILTGGQTGEVYDATTAGILYRHHSPINCGIRIERCGARLCVLGTYSGEGLVLRDDGDRLSLVATLPMSTSAIKGLATDGRTIFGTSANASVVFYSIETLAALSVVEDAHGQIVNGAACCGAGTFASVSRDLFLRIWEVWEDGASSAYRTPHEHSVRCVAAAEGFVATGAYDGTVAIFDLATRAWRGRARPTYAGISTICATSRAGEFLASSYDGRVYRVSTDGLKVRAAPAVTRPAPRRFLELPPQAAQPAQAT